MTFAENLKRYRKLRGISRKEIAKKLNILETSYGLYEQGRAKPDTEKLIIIAEMLKISIDELLDFHIDELQRCINQWNNAGFEVEVHDNPANPLLLDALKAKSILDESKEDSVYITIHNKEEIKRMAGKGISGMTMQRSDFIELTKELEERGKALSTTIFKQSAEMLFLNQAKELKL